MFSNKQSGGLFRQLGSRSPERGPDRTTNHKALFRLYCTVSVTGAVGLRPSAVPVTVMV